MLVNKEREHQRRAFRQCTIWIRLQQCNKLGSVSSLRRSGQDLPGHMSPRDFTSSRPSATRFAAMAAAVCVAAPLSAGAVELGPPPGAVLSREKLSSIDDFINGEVASGNIPGVIVLIQRHGQPVYFKCFGKRDVEMATPTTAASRSARLPRPLPAWRRSCWSIGERSRSMIPSADTFHLSPP